MAASIENEKDYPADEDKSVGLKVVEKLLPILGPPAVGDATEPPKEATQEGEEQQREMDAKLVRKQGADGTSYVQPQNE